MKRYLLVGVAILAAACGSSSPSSPSNTAADHDRLHGGAERRERSPADHQCGSNAKGTGDDSR